MAAYLLGFFLSVTTFLTVLCPWSVAKEIDQDEKWGGLSSYAEASSLPYLRLLIGQYMATIVSHMGQEVTWLIDFLIGVEWLYYYLQ